MSQRDFHLEKESRINERIRHLSASLLKLNDSHSNLCQVAKTLSIPEPLSKSPQLSVVRILSDVVHA